LAAVAGICSILSLLGLGLLFGSQHLTGWVSAIAGEAALVIGAFVLLIGCAMVLRSF
jgi:hypothetical protein